MRTADIIQTCEMSSHRGASENSGILGCYAVDVG
jgi:hypothetical protein